MSEKRKDNKKRILNTGESQRKDGRYMFKYTDNSGEIKYVYSWKLVKTDVTPKGKRDGLSLREKEKIIQRDLEDGLLVSGDITVLELVRRYTEQKYASKFKTQQKYQYVVNILEKDSLGRRMVKEIRQSEAKAWLVKQQKEEGRSYNTIQTIRNIIKPAFEMAVNDDLIRKNPFDFKLTGIVVDDRKERGALTQEQEENFLEFIKNDYHYQKYYDAIYVLFKTGLRISEFIGLTVQDIDFKNEVIWVNHQLLWKKTGDCSIVSTKSEAGTRSIPMMYDVKKCLQRIIKNRDKPTIEPIIDGKIGFLYLGRKNMPLSPQNWESYFRKICKKYNETYEEQLPTVTPHVCRHTFCSNLAKAGMNPKVLQKVMGHDDIKITLNVYTHIDFTDIKEESRRICGES